MQRVIAGLALLIVSLASSGEAFSADDTRAQHRDWMRKLDAPGGTLPEAVDMLMEHKNSRRLVPGGTTAQHRSWIRKLEVSGSMDRVSL